VTSGLRPIGARLLVDDSAACCGRWIIDVVDNVQQVTLDGEPTGICI
jgi:hypothetical protein